MSRELTFYNLSQQEMTFDEVYDRLISFIKKDPTSLYRLAIGTDSQVHANGTRFVTTIHLHRVGRGAWGVFEKRDATEKNYVLKGKNHA